jgi:hypothetical protein
VLGRLAARAGRGGARRARRQAPAAAGTRGSKAFDAAGGGVAPGEAWHSRVRP